MFDPETSEQFDYSVLQRKLDRVKSRVFVGTNAAFMAPLMSSLSFIWSTDVDTAATNGDYIWWNPKFFLEGPTKYLEPRFNEFVLRHELWHIALLHMLRGDRYKTAEEAELFQKACDYKINLDLHNMGFSMGKFPGLLDKRYANMAEEEIFNYLKKLQDAGEFIPVSGWGNGDIVVDKATPVPPEKIINKVVRSITAAKKEGKPGDIPGNAESLVDHFLAPKIPWEVHLRQWMGDLATNDFTWARPNRRHQEIYLPSTFEDDGRLEHLRYYCDCSGSISYKEVQVFQSELKYVWDEYKPQKMSITQWDTRITDECEYLDGDEFARVKIRGGGGTDIECVRQDIIKHKPTAAIIFTDMCFTPMQPLPFDIPILFVSTNGFHQVPFGKCIQVKI